MVASVGKDLQVGKNWTTFVVTDKESLETRSVVSYKNLHRLEPEPLEAFIEREIVKWGGNQVHIFVGKGDWYSTPEDVAKKWGIDLDSPAVTGYPLGAGIRSLWFDGLEDKLYFLDPAPPNRPVGTPNEQWVDVDMRGRIYETKEE